MFRRSRGVISAILRTGPALIPHYFLLDPKKFFITCLIFSWKNHLGPASMPFDVNSLLSDVQIEDLESACEAMRCLPKVFAGRPRELSSVGGPLPPVREVLKEIDSHNWVSLQAFAPPPHLLLPLMHHASASSSLSPGSSRGGSEPSRRYIPPVSTSSSSSSAGSWQESALRYFDRPIQRGKEDKCGGHNEQAEAKRLPSSQESPREMYSSQQHDVQGLQVTPAPAGLLPVSQVRPAIHQSFTATAGQRIEGPRDATFWLGQDAVSIWRKESTRLPRQRYHPYSREMQRHGFPSSHSNGSQPTIPQGHEIDRRTSIPEHEIAHCTGSVGKPNNSLGLADIIHSGGK